MTVLGNCAEHLPGMTHGLTCLLVVEDWDWHAPLPLARDTPIRAAGGHGSDARNAARRKPLHLLDGIQSLLLEAFHRCKPLLSGPEDHRLFGAPVVRIPVLIPLLLQHELKSAKRFNACKSAVKTDQKLTWPKYQSTIYTDGLQLPPS